MILLCCRLSCCILTKFGQHFPLFWGILKINFSHDQVRTLNWTLNYWYQPLLSFITFGTKSRLSAEISRNFPSTSPVILPFRTLHWPETAFSTYRMAFYCLLLKLLDVFFPFLELFSSNSALFAAASSCCYPSLLGCCSSAPYSRQFSKRSKECAFPAF